MLTVLAWLLIVLGVLLTSVGLRRLLGVGGIQRAAAVSMGAGSFRFTTHDGQEIIGSVPSGTDQLPPADSPMQVYYPANQPHAAKVENLVRRVFSWFLVGDAIAIVGILILVI